MNGLSLAIRRFDDWLSQVEGVQPFTDDPCVILRLQTGRLAREIPLPDGKIPAGSDVLFIHLWNGKIPAIPPDGPDLAWARRTQRLMLHSFRAVAQHLHAQPALHSIHAVGGVIAQAHLQGADGGRTLLEHLGFKLYPYQRPAGAFGEFWENFYTWWLMWAFNPASTRNHPMFRLQRNEFWMSREKFLELFDKKQPWASR